MNAHEARHAVSARDKNIAVALALLKEARAEIVEIRPMSQMIKFPQMLVGDIIVRIPQESK